MVSNRISSVFFSSAFALLLGACLLLPNNGYAAVVGDYDCSGSVDISDAVMIIGLILGYAEPVDCDPAEICEECEECESPVSGADLCGEGTEWDEGLQQCVGVESIDCFQSGFCDAAYWDGYGNAPYAGGDECGYGWDAADNAGGLYWGQQMYHDLTWECGTNFFHYLGVQWCVGDY